MTWEELDPSEITADTIPSDTASQLQDTPDADETVRVIIELSAEPAVSLMADGEDASDPAVAAQRQALLELQQDTAETISEQALDGETLDVRQNLTLLTNAMSANVAYGKLDAIRAVDGVAGVYVESQYKPLEASTSSIVAQEMTGANLAKETGGYYGAGTRIAVIDTGTDTDHQSFAGDSYKHALLTEAVAKGESYDEYVASLDLLTADEIEQVLPQLHVSALYDGLTADDLYLSAKLPFSFNYIDHTLDVTHDNDTQGGHGSHVAGIAAANTYIAGSADDALTYDFNGDGSFDRDDAQAVLDYAVKGDAIKNEDAADLNGDGVVTSYDAYVLLLYLDEYERDGHVFVCAADAVGVTGAAPDAQIITMKVFGQGGGAYSSDYMAAIEDAVVLDCDVVNLSLGSSSSGYANAIYAPASSDDDPDAVAEFSAKVMKNLEKTNTVMSVAAGNDGDWADNGEVYQLMYADEVDSGTLESPASYDNALAVASVDNVGKVSQSYSEFRGETGSIRLTVADAQQGEAELWRTLGETDTSYDVVFLGDPSELLTGGEQTDADIYGEADAFDGLDLTGKIVVIARGSIAFADKYQNAAGAGAAAVLLYNNVSGSLTPNIAGSTAAIPCGMIQLEQAKQLFALCSKNEDGLYSCTVTVNNQLYIDHGEGETVQISDFSSWGATGALTLKPEIAAPGGGIYSVNGTDTSGAAYETKDGTSMATPHISGLTALASQYIRGKGLLETARAASGSAALTRRALIQSLLMSTAVPIVEQSTGIEYSVRSQGAGLANIQNVLDADSFILTEDSADGKVKAELGDGTNGWTFRYTVNNLTDETLSYDLSASLMTTGVTEETNPYGDDGETVALTAKEMTALGAQVTYSGATVSDGAVTVPAGGSASVSVNISVPDDVAAALKAKGFTNGFYVEGFLYLTARNGSAGHSIPVLGWYGDWSDPSMYDSGSLIEYAYDTQERPSHFWKTIGDSYPYLENVLEIAVGDEVPLYSGNPYNILKSETAKITEGDGRYLAARNALNNTANASWTLSRIYPTLIRNAAKTRLTVTDADTGEVYYSKLCGVTLGSYYRNSTSSGWCNTTPAVSIDWDGTDASGNLLKEGTRVTLTYTAVPEYCVADDGSVNWDALGKGTDLSFSFTIDNTAPTLKSATVNGDTLSITAQDENYIACVQLLSSDKSKVLSRVYPDMDEGEKGAEQDVEIDLTGYDNDETVTILIADYAGNERYYKIDRDDGSVETQPAESGGETAQTESADTFDATATPETALPAQAEESAEPAASADGTAAGLAGADRAA